MRVPPTGADAPEDKTIHFPPQQTPKPAEEVHLSTGGEIRAAAQKSPVFREKQKVSDNLPSWVFPLTRGANTLVDRAFFEGKGSKLSGAVGILGISLGWAFDLAFSWNVLLAANLIYRGAMDKKAADFIEKPPTKLTESPPTQEQVADILSNSKTDVETEKILDIETKQENNPEEKIKELLKERGPLEKEIIPKKQAANAAMISGSELEPGVKEDLEKQIAELEEIDKNMFGILLEENNNISDGKIRFLKGCIAVRYLSTAEAKMREWRDDPKISKDDKKEYDQLLLTAYKNREQISEFADLVKKRAEEKQPPDPKHVAFLAQQLQKQGKSDEALNLLKWGYQQTPESIKQEYSGEIFGTYMAVTNPHYRRANQFFYHSEFLEK